MKAFGTLTIVLFFGIMAKKDRHLFSLFFILFLQKQIGILSTCIAGHSKRSHIFWLLDWRRGYRDKCSSMLGPRSTGCSADSRRDEGTSHPPCTRTPDLCACHSSASFHQLIWTWWPESGPHRRGHTSSGLCDIVPRQKCPHLPNRTA